MGANLCRMLGVPAEARCLSCGETFPTHFEDHNLGQEGLNPGPGEWALRVACSHCGARLQLRLVVNLQARKKLDAHLGEVLADWFKLPSERRRRFLAHVRNHAKPEGPVAAEVLEKLEALLV